MEWIITTAIAIGTLSLATYAQVRIPYHTANTRQALFTRLMLILVGLAFGVVMAAPYGQSNMLKAALIFLAAFGVVHIPAAAVLFLKRQRAGT